jgi:hypothetical protein
MPDGRRQIIGFVSMWRDKQGEKRIASPENVPERLIVTSPLNTGYIRYAKLAFN